MLLQMSTEVSGAGLFKPSALSKPGVEGEGGAASHRIRITLTARNVKNLEKGVHTPLRSCRNDIGLDEDHSRNDIGLDEDHSLDS